MLIHRGSFLGPNNPHLGKAMQTPFSLLSFGKSFMKIRSRERLSHILWRTEKNQKKSKKTKKTSVKHIRIRLIGGCVNKRNPDDITLLNLCTVPVN